MLIFSEGNLNVLIVDTYTTAMHYSLFPPITLRIFYNISKFFGLALLSLAHWSLFLSQCSRLSLKNFPFSSSKYWMTLYNQTVSTTNWCYFLFTINYLSFSSWMIFKSTLKTLSMNSLPWDLQYFFMFCSFCLTELVYPSQVYEPSLSDTLLH